MTTKSATKTLTAPQVHILLAGLLAGLGGTLPNLCRVAGNVSSPSDIELLTLGYWVATGIYFLIAFILCVGMQERRIREAFVLGIAAPALIASFASSRSASSAVPQLSALLPIGSAVAAQVTQEPSAFWQDLKRGFGFRVPTRAEVEAQSELLEQAQLAEDRAKLLESMMVRDREFVARLTRQLDDQPKSMPEPKSREVCPVCEVAKQPRECEKVTSRETDDESRRRRLYLFPYLANKLELSSPKISEQLRRHIVGLGVSDGIIPLIGDCREAEHALDEVLSDEVSDIEDADRLVTFTFMRSLACDASEFREGQLVELSGAARMYLFHVR